MLHPKLAVKILQLLRRNENGMTVSHLKLADSSLEIQLRTTKQDGNTIMAVISIPNNMILYALQLFLQ